jgi:hypothetical protein
MFVSKYGPSKFYPLKKETRDSYGSVSSITIELPGTMLLWFNSTFPQVVTVDQIICNPMAH